MKNLLLISLIAGALMGCEATDAIKSTNDMKKGMDNMQNKMDTTNGEISRTNQSVHKQTLLVAIEELTKKENQVLLDPVPTSLMAAGRTFAEKATANEIVSLSYIWLKEIEEVAPLKNVDPADPSTELPYTTEEINAIRRDKLAKLAALQVIAGFIPDGKDFRTEAGREHELMPDTLGQIINDEIYGYGRFQKTAFAVLMMRFLFVKNVMLKSSLLQEPLLTSGSMEEALKYLKKVDFLVTLPFAARLQLSVTDRVTNLFARDERMDDFALRDAALVWDVALDRAQQGFDTSVLVQQQGGGTNNEEKALQQRLLEEIRKRAVSDNPAVN